MKSMSPDHNKNDSYFYKNKSHSHLCQQLHPLTNMWQSQGVHYYFQGWLKETLDSKDARTIINPLEVIAVIGEFVEGKID